jgi:hypothetical protein
MKNTCIPLLSLFLSSAAVAQIQLDKPVELTGSGSDARVTGIETATDPSDAVSAQMIQHNGVTYALATHSGNDFSVTLSPAPAAYAAGMAVHFKSQTDITGTVQLDVSGLGLRPIVKNFNSPLVANDIRNGQMVSVLYDGSNFQMVSPPGQSAAPAITSTWTPVTSFTTVAPVLNSTPTVCIANGGVVSSSGRYFEMGDMVFLEGSVILQNRYNSCNCSNGVQRVDITLPINAANVANAWGEAYTWGLFTGQFQPNCMASRATVALTNNTTVRINPGASDCLISTTPFLARWSTCAQNNDHQTINFSIAYQRE